METLRHCLPPSVRCTLDELPEFLDETYKRILKEIKKPNLHHARRVLQCLVVAIRPLRLSELAEVLAVDFGDEGIPKLNPNWRWEDQEQALLSSCSSLIAIVESDESRIVQFSHFSVKEFLTSERLATSIGNISRYHIVLEPAHTILAQACMSVLLRSDDRFEEGRTGNSSSLVRYAAEHWVTHAQDGKLSSCLQRGIEYLFDASKPYFSAWLQLHDLDTLPRLGSTSHVSALWDSKSGGTPLYYAALCGFQDLVEHLIINDPKDVNATGGYYVTPLIAALAGRHFQTAKLLRDKGAHPNIGHKGDNTPLHSAAFYGDLEMVQVLLKYKADVNAQNSGGRTPLDSASEGFYFGATTNIALSLSKVARLLLEHGADVNARSNYHTTPLHFAAKFGRVEVVRVLLEHVANLGMEDDDGKTAIQAVSEYVNARDFDGQTPLHFASRGPSMEGPNIALSLSSVARLLLEHGAEVNAQGNGHSTPLHVAVQYGRAEAVRVLLEHGANVAAKDEDGKTASQLSSDMGHEEITKLLSEHRAR